MSGDSVPAGAPLVVNGWSIYAHPLFLDQLEGLIEEVEVRKARDPRPGARKPDKTAGRRLQAGHRGHTGGPECRSLPARRHTRRSPQALVPGEILPAVSVVLPVQQRCEGHRGGWVNDDKTLRAYGSKTDAYATFKGMLEDGNPPDDFDAAP